MLSLPSLLDRERVPHLLGHPLLRPGADGRVVVDAAALDRLDSVGAAFLADLARACRRRGGQLVLKNLSPRGRQALALHPLPPASPPPPPAAGGRRAAPGAAALAGVGGQALAAAQALAGWARLVGRLMVALAVGPARGPALRRAATAEQMIRLGARGLGVVVVILALVGGTLAMQSAHQLRQFGAQLFVVDLLGISITRELGPLITAVVMAGRSGAAIAAELASMSVAEELAALETMGIDLPDYLLLPRLAGLVLTLPLLTIAGDAAALCGGALVAWAGLDLPPATFFERLQATVTWVDFVGGLGKSALFAALIVTIAAIAGLGCRGGAAQVGQATTRCVVGSIFAVVGADALLSLVLYRA